MIAQNKQNKEQITEYNGKEPLKGKREKFAQEIAKGDCNHTEACRKANYKDHKGLRIYANKLITNPLIKARIDYIRAELAKKWDITKDSQVKEYIGIRTRAIEAGDLRAEISANNSIDKLCGLIVDKVQHEQTDAQVARTAVDRQQAARYAKWELEQSLARPEALQAVNVVDITVDGADITDVNGSSGCMSGCSNDSNSAITGQ